MNEVPCTGYIQQLKSYLCTFCAIIYGSEEGQIFHNYRKTFYPYRRAKTHYVLPFKNILRCFPRASKGKTFTLT